MKQRLQQYLVCPDCRTSLELTIANQEAEEIISGTLTCARCHANYPIRGGVPRFVQSLPSDREKTQSAFGYQWTTFTRMYEAYKAQFLDWIYPIQEEFFKDKIVLDAGCGIGRHTYYAACFSAKEVIGVDLSDAVDTCYENVARHQPNAHVIQADIYRLPFAPETFDFVYSIGVLHHLPDPEAGFRQITSKTRPGGTVFGWVYGYENNWFIHLIVDPVRKRVTRYLPFSVLKALSYLLTLVLQITVKGVYRPLNKLGFRYLPLNDYLYHLSNFTFGHNYVIVFDHLVAPTAFYLRRDEFEQWFNRLEMSKVEISWRNRNSWRGQGQVTANSLKKITVENA